MICRGLLVLVAVAGVGVGVATASQEQGASLEGRVTDASGAVVPGARVVVSGDVPGTFASVAAEDGRFWFPALPAGRASIAVDVAGFQPVRVDVELTLGAARRLDVELLPAAVDQQVQVVARAPSIDTLQSGSFRVVAGDTARLLPNSREFTSLVSMLPGANSEGRLAGLSIDGASGAENRILNDGADSTDIINGTSGKGMRVDFLGELQVKSSGYAAEFGGSTGGVLSALLRSGTDSYQGGVATYYSGNAMRGAIRPTLRRSPVASDRAEYVTFEDDDFSSWAPLLTIGGPIVRGRAWFFAGGEWSRLRTTRRTRLVDGSLGTFTSGSDTATAVGTADVQMTGRLRTRGTFNVTPSRSQGALPARAVGNEPGTSSPLEPWDRTGSRSFAGTGSMQADYVLGSWLYLNARGGAFRDTARTVGIPADIKYVFTRTNIGVPGVPADLQRPGGFTNVATNTAITRDRRARVHGTLAGTVYRTWLGAHVLKGGVQFERYAHDVLEGDQNDWVVLNWGLSYPTTDGRLVRGALGYYSVSRGFSSGDVSGTNVGVFLQDAWRLTDRLTVDLGLRTEREVVPSYDTSLGQSPVALRFGFGDKLAPRVGIAYDPGGRGRSRLYASAGRYYDAFKLDTPRAMFGGEKFGESFYTLDSADWTAIGANGRFPGQLIETLNYRYPFNAPDAADYGVGVEPNLQPFSQWETTLGFEQQFGGTVVAGVRYVRKGITRAIEDVGSVVPGLGEFFSLANPGFGIARTTEPTACAGPCPDQPRAIRDYDAVEVTVTRRQRGRWFADASYVWSRLYGNYSGLANSDEGGRANPNFNRVFDALHSSFDAQGQPVLGRLATDRPHQFKINGAYQMPFGLSIGGRFLALSGTPEQIEAANLNVAFYPYGRGSLGRYPTFTQTDLLLLQTIRAGANRSLHLEFNVSNLFDQQAVTSRVRTPYLQSLNLNYQRFFSGFDLAAEAARLRLTPNPLYGFDGGYGPGASSFQARRSLRVAVRATF